MKKIYKSLALIVLALGCIILIQPKANAADSAGNFVVVLDPGHGPNMEDKPGDDPGAIGGGIREDQVNFKLAQYAKEELEKYEGVKVYLTRYNNCPTIYNRVEIAKRYNADLLVSMHINSGGGGSAKGAAVWITQDNTKVEYKEKAAEVASLILNQISSLGIRNNGVQIRSGQPNEWYDSGVVQDYYGIIRYAQRVGMRSLLVEHCYIDNASDRQFINSDDAIRRLALADVRGIVDAYKLELKGSGKEPVRKMSLDKTELNLEISTDNPQPLNFINPIFNPSNAYNKEVDYWSSNPNVARVYGERIRGLTPGETTITAISRNNQRIAKCKVIVTKPDVALKDITTDTTQQIVNIDETGDIIVNFNPSNASDKTLYWESSDQEVVRIWNGHFRGLKEGKAVITALSRAGGKKISCEVIVRDPNKTYVEAIDFQQKEYTVDINEAMDIPYTYAPTDAVNAEFYWTSSNDEIIRVWGNRFRALKPGTAEVIVRTIDGTVEKRIEVTVNDPGKVEKINIEKTEYSVNVNDAIDIPFTYAPVNAANAEFYWTSSNDEIIRVWGNRFRALKPGTAEVIVRTIDGTVENKIKVTVKNNGSIQYVTKINTEKEEYTAKVDEAVDISYTYAPTDAVNAEFYWTSSDDEILRVWGNRFRALKPGTAEVIVRTIDGTVEKRIKVTVKNNGNIQCVTKINTEKEEYTAKVDEAIDIPFTYTPTDAVNAEFYWISSDSEILRVWGNRFRALKPGTAEVIVRTIDGTVEKRIKVTVE